MVAPSVYEILLRPDSGGVRDQVFESTNLIPSMGWGSVGAKSRPIDLQHRTHDPGESA